MRHANFRVVKETPSLVLIEDVGPWEQHWTVTNDAEAVVKRLAPMLQGRRLEYIDSLGNRDQILVEDGEFAGFAPAKPENETVLAFDTDVRRLT